MLTTRAQATTEEPTPFEIHFNKLEDPRRHTGNFKYPLIEILLLTISSALCGYTKWTEIEEFGNSKLDWLKGFLPYENGIPSHDILGEIFGRIDPERFAECFMGWVNYVSELSVGEVIALDGKTARGSGGPGVRNSALHILSAYATKAGLCIGQQAVEKKENEIVAIPKLLETLAIKGCIVTIDAMGCQKGIAQKILDQEADYILMVKENQPELLGQVEKLFEIGNITDSYKGTDCGHGRVEERLCECIADLRFFDVKDQWPGIRSIIRITSSRYIKRQGKQTLEHRYYISSLEPVAQTISSGIRDHWKVENALHWSLDVTFREDGSQKKDHNAVLNYNMISKIALAKLRNDKTINAPITRKIQKATLNDDYREILLKS